MTTDRPTILKKNHFAHCPEERDWLVSEIRYDTIRYDTIRYDTIRYDTIRYDTIRYDTIRYDNTLLSQKGNSFAVFIKYIYKTVK